MMGASRTGDARSDDEHQEALNTLMTGITEAVEIRLEHEDRHVEAYDPAHCER